MNKRIRKKFAKRSYVRHYSDYRMLVRTFTEFLDQTGYGGYRVDDHWVIVEEGARRIWVELVKSFRHGHRPRLTYEHIRFTSHLNVISNTGAPPMPAIALTERPDPTPFVPIVIGGPLKELHDHICECLKDTDEISEYHGIVTEGS